MGTHFLQQAIVFLGAALLCVPLAKRLGIGSVLGYLLAGVLIGPFVLGFVGAEGEDVMHASEFGVVMMLFLIGLELNPQSFWSMRKAILGLGGSQLLATTAAVFALLYGVFGWPIETSFVVAAAFTMSSTAIALQTLKERGLGDSQAGQASFAVLLMQDIAVIPLLALLPLLAIQEAAAAGESGTGFKVLTSLGAIGFLIVAGRWLVNPFLRSIARTRVRELFTASALLLVIGVAYLMQLAGLSAALGAFLAGMLLANSEYRHELESDVEPFKGLLLGLFFTAVGSTINFNLIRDEPALLFALVGLVLLVKIAVLLFIGHKFGLKTDQNLLFSLLLCQVGEFAFVLLAAAGQLKLLDKHILEMGMAVTTVTMVLSPLLLFLNERFIDPRFGTREVPDDTPADKVDEKHKVIIAGFGHFGSTVGRFLRAAGVEATILDHDSDRVDLLRKMGFKVYYGDSTRLDLLKSAGADEAKILISAIDSEEETHTLVDVVRKHFPHLQLFVRTKHRYHTYDLLAKGPIKTYRESLHSSVYMGVDVLHAMGFRNYTATRKAQEFIKYDEGAIEKLSKEWAEKDKERYALSARVEIELQEKLLREDVRFISNLEDDNAWDSDTLRAEAISGQ
ncbi:MAG: cation:proton antiporter [Saprospiraceae bacterium]|nr:cation:proton antiporter [Saprospiraceae bacterium]